MKMKFKRVVAFLLTVMMAFSTAGSDMMSAYASAFTAQTDAPDDQTGRTDSSQPQSTQPGAGPEETAQTQAPQTSAQPQSQPVQTDGNVPGTTAQSGNNLQTQAQSEQVQTTGQPDSQQTQEQTTDNSIPAQTGENTDPAGSGANNADTNEPAGSSSETAESENAPAQTDPQSFDILFNTINSVDTKIKVDGTVLNGNVYKTAESSVKFTVEPESGYEVDLDATRAADPSLSIRPTDIVNEYIVDNINSNITINIHMKLLPEESDGEEPPSDTSETLETEMTESETAEESESGAAETEDESVAENESANEADEESESSQESESESANDSETKATDNSLAVNGGLLTPNAVALEQPELTDFSVVADRSQISVGETANLTAIFVPSDYPYKDVQWESADPKIARVNAQGVVTALAEGEVEVTATLKENPDYTASVVIVVDPVKVSSVEITSEIDEYYTVGEALTLKASVEPLNAAEKTIKWSVKDGSDDVIKVDPNTGKVTMVGQGTATVIATAQDGSGAYDEVELTVYEDNPKELTVNIWVTNQDKKESYQVFIPSDGTEVAASALLKTVDGFDPTGDIRVGNWTSGASWGDIKNTPVAEKFRYNKKNSYFGSIQYYSNRRWKDIGRNEKVISFCSLVYEGSEEVQTSTGVKVTVDDWPYEEGHSSTGKGIQLAIVDDETGKRIYDSGIRWYDSGNNTELGGIIFNCDESRYEVDYVEVYNPVTERTTKKSGNEKLYADFTGRKKGVYKFTAHIRAKKFQVTYDSNGGIGKVPASESIKAINGNKVTVKSSPVPSREGYIFGGWQYNGKVYQGGESFEMPPQNITFEAYWVPASEMIKYVAGEGGTITRQSEMFKGPEKVKGSTAKPNNGYKFVKWQDSSGRTVSEGTTFRPESAGVYTAVFEKIKYTITTEAVNGTISDGGSVTYGGAFVVTFSANQGYILDSIIVNGTALKYPGLYNGRYTFRNIRSNQTIKVVYKRDTSEFKVIGVDKVYDGQPASVTTNGALVDGEKWQYSLDKEKWEDEAPSSTDVTVNEKSPNGQIVYVRIVDASEENIIWQKQAYVKIEKRNVTLTSGSDEKAYDGDPLTNSEVTVSGDGFVEDEGAEYSFTGSQTLVGSSENYFSYTLTEGTNANNYTITQVNGTLTVSDRDEDAKYQITVEAKSDTVKYDGTEHSVSGLEEDTFEVAGHTYTVSGLSAEVSGTDAGSYTAQVTGTAVVEDADGNDVTNQFKVNRKSGTLTIEKRNVTLTSGSDEKAYDGDPLTNSEVTVSGDGFVEGEGAEYSFTGSQTLVGKSDNTFDYAFNRETKKENYVITTEEGTLTVTDGSSEEPVDPDKVVTKTHDDKTYGLGDIITFTIQVTNIYDTAKTITIKEQNGVTIIGQSVFENVAPGETVKTTAEYVVTQADLRSGSFTNKVTAQFEGGKDYTNIDTVEDLDDLNSHIVITKKATSTPENGESYALGETISYEITVKNDGNVTVNNIVIEDELTGNTGDQAWTIPSLEPGEFKTFYPSYTVTEEDILLGEVVNEAVMSSAEKADEKDPAPDTTPGADTQKTDEKNSHITINKVVTSTPANGSGYALDETITYKITVVNDGNLTVEDITVIDELTEDEWYIDSLAPGSSEEYEAEYKVTENDILAGNVANEATASGTSIDPGQPEVPVDPGEVDVPTDEKEGHITISKEVTSTPDNKNAYALGETITYKITATNDGNLTVKDVIVTDELTGETWDKVTLAPGESKEYTTEYTVTEQDILNGTVLNVAAATGESPDPEQPEVPVKPGEEEVPTVTPQPSLFVEKEAQPKADGSDYGLGDTITYIITVTNNGNVTINDITVEDALTGNVGENALHIDTLAPNTTETLTVQYVVTEEDILAGSIANSVTVSGTDPDGEDVPADDEVIVDVEEANPELTLTKTTTSTPENGESYALNETITYEIIAANTGNLTLTNVVVNDELTGDTWTIGTLEPGESQSFEASYVVTETDIHNGNIVNVATAEADNPTNDPENPSEEPDKPTTVVPGETDDKTDEEAPSLAVTKNVVNAADEYQIGDVVEYEITVTNNGNVTQNGIVVEDNIQAAGDVVITNISGVQGTINGSTVILEALAPGQTAVISCEYTVLKEDRGTTIINTAKVTGDEEEPDVTPDVPVDVEDVYDIYVVHEFAAGEAENASLPNDYTIENLAPGTVRELNAEAVEGYTAYPAAQTAVVEDQDVTVVFTYYTDEMGTDPENPEKPDGIPDTYQANITYAVNNGTLSFNNAVVTLYDSNGNPSESGTGYLMGTQIPDAAPNEGYGSLNWTPQVPDTKTPITGDMTFTANFVINSYTVTFLVNGMIVDTQTVIHGQSAADPGYTAPDGYRFSGWSRSLENITGNTVITGTTILIPVPPVPTPEPTPTPDPAPVPDPAPTPDPAPEITPQQNPGTTAPVNPADDDTDDADNDDDTDDADVIDIDDEETPLGDAPGKNESETEYDLTVLEDEETPLSDGQDNGDSNHKCCILHFLLLCAALIIELLYTHSQKKRQKHIFELREMLAEKNGGRIE